MKKIVALTSFPEQDFKYEREMFGRLSETEFIISYLKNPDEVIEIVRDADVILFTDVPMNSEFLNKLEKCKLIIRYGIGYDNIDIKSAAQKGIIVCNAPNYGVVDVAEHAISLMLSCTKRLTYRLHQGRNVEHGRYGLVTQNFWKNSWLCRLWKNCKMCMRTHKCIRDKGTCL